VTVDVTKLDCAVEDCRQWTEGAVIVEHVVEVDDPLDELDDGLKVVVTIEVIVVTARDIVLVVVEVIVRVAVTIVPSL
jgi:hypothetical protein